MLKKVPLLLVLAATTVVAQDLLDPVVVTATRSARPARTVPYTTSLFDSRFTDCPIWSMYPIVTSSNSGLRSSEA